MAPDRVVPCQCPRKSAFDGPAPNALDHYPLSTRDYRLVLLREVSLALPFSGEDSRQRVIPLVTGILVDRTFDLGHRDRGGPGRHVPAWIVDSHLVVHRVRAEPREALDDTPA